MRTSIKLTSSTEVTLAAIDPFSGEAVEWEFFIPANGGYVRLRGRRGNSQVCQRLGGRGVTLWCEDGASLLTTIRSEWRKYRADAKAQGFLR